MQIRNDTIEELEESASVALVKLFDAQERQADRDTLENLEQQYNVILVKIEDVKSRFNAHGNKGSTSAVMSKLSQLSIAQPVVNLSQACAQPLHIFTKEENDRINKHYESMRQDLKLLFDAALEDSSISMDKIDNPVFLKNEGYVYDAASVDEMLGNKTAVNYPRNPSVQFTRKEVIPCNTLIKAKLHMLNIMEDVISTADPVEMNTYMQPAYDNAQSNIPPEIIKIIETYYMKGIEAKHRVLFDAVCRDSCTNMIMQRPVFLPDGYVYDRSTVMQLLDSAYFAEEESAMCPMANITFKIEDITRCRLAEAVLEQLKNNILASQQHNQNEQIMSQEDKSDQCQRVVFK